jgi:hypothetical protein
MVVNGGGTHYAGVLAGPGVRTGLMKLPKGEVASNLIEVHVALPAPHTTRNLPSWGLIFSAVDTDGKESEVVSRINAKDPNATDAVVAKIKVPVGPNEAAADSADNVLRPPVAEKR